MRHIVSLVFALCALTCVIVALWLIETVRAKPDIPSQTPEVSYIQIVLHQKPKKPIDNFCVPGELQY